MGRGWMEQMLTDLGDLLAARGLRFHLAVIGGTALLLRAVVDRTTRDVDAIGVLEDGEWVPLDELPPDLAGAVEDVALLHGESKDWLNVRPSDLLRIGTVSDTHLRAHETRHEIVCRLLLEKK